MLQKNLIRGISLWNECDFVLYILLIIIYTVLQLIFCQDNSSAPLPIMPNTFAEYLTRDWEHLFIENCGIMISSSTLVLLLTVHGSVCLFLLVCLMCIAGQRCRGWFAISLMAPVVHYLPHFPYAHCQIVVFSCVLVSRQIYLVIIWDSCLATKYWVTVWNSLLLDWLCVYWIYIWILLTLLQSISRSFIPEYLQSAR